MPVLGAMAPAVLWSLAGVFAVLAVASSIVPALRLAHPQSDYSELWRRIRSWWIMAGLFAIVIILDRRFALVFFGFLSFLALKEYLSLIPTRRADRRVMFWAYAAIPFQYLWIAQGWYGMFIIFIPVYAFLFIPMRMVTIGETTDFLRAAGTLHWGLMATVFSLSHAAYLLVLPASGNPVAGGAGLLLFLILLTQLNDVGQYVWGKSLGRHKVVPAVSPNKTWEGLVGGVLTTVALAFLMAPWLTPLTAREALAAGVVLGLGGFVGDVVISALKRDLGIKDTGSLIPGHGGVLDRLDSLTYTAPLFFHLIYYLHY